MRFLLTCFMLCFSSVLFADDIAGVYAIPSKDDVSYIEIFQKNGKFYGVGFANKSGKDAGNDVKNPDPKLRDRKVGESVFLWNLTHKENGKYHNGKLYNFQNGETYHVSAEYHNGKLKVRVSKDKKGIFGTTLAWQKMSEKEIAPYQAKRPNIESLQLPK